MNKVTFAKKYYNKMKKNKSITPSKSNVKRINSFFITVSILFLLVSTIVKGQATQAILVDKESLSATKIEKNNWVPLKINESGNSKINGVSFLKEEVICNEQQVVIVKLLNTNQYAVSVNYTESNGEKKSISIPGLSEVIGNCDDINKVNANKLLVRKKPTTDAERQENKKIALNVEVLKVE